jgi:hypothetical protein
MGERVISLIDAIPAVWKHEGGGVHEKFVLPAQQPPHQPPGLCLQISKQTRRALVLHYNNCTSSVIEPSERQLDKLPSSSNVKPSSNTVRQTASDDSSTPSTQRDGRRGDHSSRQHSPKPSASAISHRRTASSSQQMNRGAGVDERRTERV